MTTMEAIAAICADRRAAGRIPVLATDGEVGGITGMSRPETGREMDRLAAAGKVVTGRTVSGRYAFPAETIELDLKTFRILQSRGHCNQDSPFHKEILSLVNNNMTAIRKLCATNK